MSFRAQYEATCERCGEAITVGQMIETATTTGELPNVIRTYQHSPDCPRDRIPAPCCARCGLNHPGEC